MATAKTITAFKYRTEVIADITKHTSEFKKADATVEKYGKTIQKVAKDTSKAFDGAAVGHKFGKDFSTSATSLITGSISELGKTLGGLVGTAIAPGIGTAIGSTVGSAVDAALEKAMGPILETIKKGIDLNELLEQTQIEFTTFAGSEKEAKAYLADLLKMSTDLGILPAVLIDASEKTYDLTSNLKLTRTIMKAAADQAADFGGKVETFQDIATQLGLIAEKGELASRELNKLYKLGIDAKKRLAEATGLSENQIGKMIAQGRVRGDVAARLIAESIEREKGGYAQRQAMTSTAGARHRFEALSQVRAAEGTQNATHALGDFYRTANDVLSSPQAQQFVKFIDDKTGSLINMVEKASRVGVNVATGLSDGITSGEALKSLGTSFTSLGNSAETMLKGVFEIKSPSERTAREIGEPMGEGIGVGLNRRFSDYMAGEGTQQLVQTLERTLEDPKVQAFFEAIKKAEGGAPNRIVGGRTVSDLSRHPNIVGMRTSKGPSTAAGSYQITGSNWYGTRGRPGLQQQLGLPDFSAHSQDLAALKLFMDRAHGAGLRALLSGDIVGARRVAAKDWTSTPGSTIGGGRQLSPEKWMGYYNQALASQGGANGAPITNANPMPVVFVNTYNDPTLTRRGRRAPRGGGDTSVSFDESSIQVQADSAWEHRMLASGLAPAALDVKNILNDLTPAVAATAAPLLTFDQSMRIASGTLGDFGLGLPPLTKEMLDFGQSARAEFALTNEVLRQNQAELIKSIEMRSQLSAAIGQAAGFLPQQKVGKKRGIFSKILGIAAPFLSFIPGVGPMLSHLAGMASAGLAGNWAGVAGGLAQGLQPGGVFAGSGGGGNSGGGAGTITGMGNGAPGHTTIRRAFGGPVYRGRRYIVGEHRAELFEPASDGWIHPRVGGQSGAGSDPGMAAMLERLHGVLARMESMKPHDVVRIGARGMMDAYAQDASLIRLSAQRHRMQ